MSDEQADEVEFGAVREAAPSARRRPDHDRHYAVATVGQPAEGDLPIYVEADAWRELIEHAQQDTRVELGGVLLGGCHTDDQGRPFVLVTDSLRAEHYEATRGSFKFTHETWTAITRSRAEFNGDVGMVGWYHTHPEWGVFLSSMDLFICEHFFGKPLDVALVLDPCRGDWGWFQWTERKGETPRRTGGFYLIAARNRQAELNALAAVFSSDGESTMPADPRWSSLPTPTHPTSPPTIHIHNPPAAAASMWPWFALLLLQSLLVAFIGWRALASQGAGVADRVSAAAADDALHRWLAAQRSEARQEAQSELMDRVLAELASAPDGSFHQMTELREEKDELAETLQAQQARQRELVAQHASQSRQAERERRSLQEQLAQLRKEQTQLREQLAAKNESLARAAARTSTAEPTATDDGEAAPALPWYRSPLVVSSAAVLLVVAIAAGWWSQQRRAGDSTEPTPCP